MLLCWCADNFYLSKDELLHDSPSRRAGVDADTEAQLRNFGCQRIQLGVLYLKLPQGSGNAALAPTRGLHCGCIHVRHSSRPLFAASACGPTCL
jgi:hypothetical protein